MSFTETKPVANVLHARAMPWLQLAIDNRDVPRVLVDIVEAHNDQVLELARQWDGILPVHHDPLTASWSIIERDKVRRRDLESESLQTGIRLAGEALDVIASIDEQWSEQVELFARDRVDLEATARSDLIEAGYENQTDAGSMRLAVAMQRHPVLVEHDAKTETARAMIRSRLPAEKRIVAARREIERDLTKLFKRWSEAHV